MKDVLSAEARHGQANLSAFSVSALHCTVYSKVPMTTRDHKLFSQPAHLLISCVEPPFPSRQSVVKPRC